MTVLSETVDILVIHKAWHTEAKLPLIQQLGDYARRVLCPT